MLCVTLKTLHSATWVGFQCLALGGWEQWNVCLKWILSQSKHRSCSSLSFPPVICLPNFLQTHSLSGGTLQQGPHANGSAAICSDPNWRSIISSWCQGHLCHLCKHTQGAARVSQLTTVTLKPLQKLQAEWNQRHVTMSSWWTINLERFHSVRNNTGKASSGPPRTWKRIRAAALAVLPAKSRSGNSIAHPPDFGLHWQPPRSLVELKFH